jgi:hypothetical protein
MASRTVASRAGGARVVPPGLVGDPWSAPPAPAHAADAPHAGLVVAAGVALLLAAVAGIAAFSVELNGYRQIPGIAFFLFSDAVDAVVVVVTCLACGVLTLTWSRRPSGAATAAAGATAVLATVSAWLVNAAGTLGAPDDRRYLLHPVPFVVTYALMAVAALLAFVALAGRRLRAPSPLLRVLAVAIGALGAGGQVGWQAVTDSAAPGKVWRVALVAGLGLAMGAALLVVAALPERAAPRAAGLVVAAVAITDEIWLAYPRGSVTLDVWVVVDALAFLLIGALALVYAFAVGPRPVDRASATG